MRRLSVCLLAVGASAGLLWPASAGADETAAPRLLCTERSLPIMAAEVSGVRLSCTVVSAPAADQTFMISLEQTPADVPEAGAPALAPRAVCSGPLRAGTGACTGLVLDAASPAFGGAHLSATLLPSGLRLEDAGAPPAETGSASGAPVFEPLPDASWP